MRDAVQKVADWAGDNKNEVASAIAVVLGIIAALGMRFYTPPGAKDE